MIQLEDPAEWADALDVVAMRFIAAGWDAEAARLLDVTAELQRRV